MTQPNWRDLYEERDRDGDTVLDVWMRDGTTLAYEYRPEGCTAFNLVSSGPALTKLIPKQPAPSTTGTPAEQQAGNELPKCIQCGREYVGMPGAVCGNDCPAQGTVGFMEAMAAARAGKRVRRAGDAGGDWPGPEGWWHWANGTLTTRAGGWITVHERNLDAQWEIEAPPPAREFSFAEALPLLRSGKPMKSLVTGVVRTGREMMFEEAEGKWVEVPGS
jgi:hypothetical protein